MEVFWNSNGKFSISGGLFCYSTNSMVSSQKEAFGLIF